MKRPQYNIINGLRFIAILHIYSSHYLSGLSNNPIYKNIVGTSCFSTSVFFILSGFMLQIIYSQKIGDNGFKRKFWIARLSKTYPLYLLSLLLMVVGNIIINKYSIPFSHTAITLLLIQAWIPISNIIYAYNIQLWSLSVIYFFYFCFPFISSQIKKISSKNILSVIEILWIVYLILPIISMFSKIYLQETISLILYKNPAIRVPEFVFGILLANMVKENRYTHLINFINNKRYYILILSVMVLASAPLYVPYPLMHNGIFLPLQGALILCLTKEKSTLINIKLNKVLSILGSSSLSFYILNAPFYYVFSKLLNLIYHNINNVYSIEFNSFYQLWITAILITIIIIILSVIAQYYFVNPMSKLIRTIIDSKENKKITTLSIYSKS